MAIIRFETNVSKTVHLRSLDGRQVESQFGGSQFMFSAEEGNFYVSSTVGQILQDQFRTLGVKPGDSVDIVKAESGSGPGRKTRWTVATSVTVSKPVEPPAVSEPPSELETQLRASIAMVEARKAQQTAAPAWASFLVEQSNALIDCYSKVLTHASQYPNVRGEDVRSIFLSTFINVSKGKQNAA